MLARLRSAVVLGVDAYPVDVEIDLANGLPAFATVGLPHGAVKEGRERVAAAIGNSGFEFPLKRITANLAPADLPKAGSAFDLPLAVGILLASGQLVPGEQCRPEEGFFFGELSLEGLLRPVRGALALVLAARSGGARWVIGPAENLMEAALVEGLEVIGARTLGDVVGHLAGRGRLNSTRLAAPAAVEASELDFADVRGQLYAKRALEVAAAGGHNVLLIGPPGGGKTMLARRLPTILPGLRSEEALEVAKIHGVAGLFAASNAIARPFRAPHHTISDAGLVGGGSQARPGEVSLAHHGVLFLDELPEFRRNVLEGLRQPLEDGVVTIARAALTLTYPARFTLIAAMNPCPCGFLGDQRRQCQCSSLAIAKYRSRISGPLLDRIDLQLAVPPASWQDLSGATSEESSQAIRDRVEQARACQAKRYRGRRGVFANAHLSARDVARWCEPEPAGRQLLGQAVERFAISARGYARTLKLARTIADLEGAERVAAQHVAEAVQYRSFDRGSGAGLGGA